jgi:hypothetical protein
MFFRKKAEATHLVDIFMERLNSTQQEYNKSKDITRLHTKLSSLAHDYSEYFGFGDLFVARGEQLIESGDYDAGITFMTTAHKTFRQIANTTTLYIRLAENEFKCGNIKSAKAYLILLCNGLDNYEESIEANGLTAVWETYKHHVENEIPASNNMYRTVEARSPDTCSRNIKDILKLSEEELLTALSGHLNELCGNGEHLNMLTAEELTIYLIDEWISDINADGIEHYLSYHGVHFLELQKAICDIENVQALTLIEKIKQKFPPSTVPLNEKSLPSALENMEAYGVDFECEEHFYYEHVEISLLNSLYNYILEISDRLR